MDITEGCESMYITEGCERLHCFEHGEQVEITILQVAHDTDSKRDMDSWAMLRLALLGGQARQLDGPDEQDGEGGHGDAADKGEAQGSLVAADDLEAIGLVEVGNGVDRGPDAGDDGQAVGPPDMAVEVVDEGVLDDEAAGGDAEDHAEAAPEDEGAGDDGLLLLGRAGEDGHEGAGELEALAERRGHEGDEVDDGGQVAAQQAQAQAADEVEEGAGEQGPLEAARPGDCEAGAGAGHGGDEGGEDEAEARGRGRGEEDGLEVEGAV